MAYRVIELIAPAEKMNEVREVIQKDDVLGSWSEDLKDGCFRMRILLNANQTEPVSDELTHILEKEKGFRIILFSVEAVVPQPDQEKQEEVAVNGESNFESDRISREELYEDVAEGSRLTRVYVSTVILSALVVSVGLLRDDVAVIIGAMVIAPLLGPNVALALAAALADAKLGWRSLKTNIVGLLAALTIAYLMGIFFMVDPNSEQIWNRTLVGPGDIAVALAAGSAGVLAFTRGVPTSIIGVMVAVALLPPLACVGLLLGGGYHMLAARAAVLTFTNLICINLAGILTFLIQGIRPRNWWDAENAKKASRYAIAIWIVLLTIFAVIIWILKQK